MNKLYSAILGAVVALGLVSTSSDAFAWGPSYNNGNCGDCCPVDCCNTVDCCNDSCCDWWVEGEAIVWTRDTRNTDYAIETAVSRSSPSLGQSKVKYLGQEWNPGWRLGLGYHLPCDCWDAKVVWTHFRNHEKETRDESGTGNVLYSTWLAPSVVGDGDHSRIAASRHTQYDVVDFLVGRALCINECFSLNPFFGIRGVWLEQNLKGYYTSNNAESKWKSKYSAGGFHGGFEGRYQLGCSWNVFAKLAGSIVAGEDDASIKQYLGSVQYIDLSDETDLLIASNGEASFGIGYDTCFCGRNLSFAVGYEFVHWWNTPDQRRFFDENAIATSGLQSNGSVGFHGAFFRVATTW